MKTLLLINVGTPDSPEPTDVGRYLNEFLMDKNIITLPRPVRDILVKLIIVPRRKFASSEKYKRVWTEQGSPLLVESQKLKNKLQSELGPQWNVVLGMQVGNPSLTTAFQQALASQDEIFVCPLYPQFATATTGGALEKTQHPAVKVLEPFHSKSWFIEAQARKIKEKLKPNDHLILSYHGLPVSQLKAKNNFCYKDATCCETEQACAQNCYKAQCLKTSLEIQNILQHKNTVTSFQSRLGPAKWIEPSTESTIEKLVASGAKSIKVACPSFVSDCLETLEEIGMELKEKFLHQGGDSFELIPCVNDDSDFIRGLATEIKGLSAK